jgi:hypothetical protein
MTITPKMALTLGLLAGFATLAVLFAWLSGARYDVLAVLAAGCGLSIFALWLATSGARRF